MGQLAAPLTEGVGREKERATVHASLEGMTRVVSVTGPAGMGKSRLAREVAAASGTQWPGGVGWCVLEPARSLAEVAGIVQRALGEGETRTVAPRQLGAWLAERGRTLVVLDQCDHLMPELAPWVARWRHAAPTCRFLVAAQRALGLEGERVVPLEPLQCPPPHERDAHAIAQTEAVRLFELRARAASPGFSLAEQRAETIAELVRRLDGLPLAIELAAARMGVLSPIELLQRLSHRFEVLTHAPGKVDGPARTLHGALEAAWNLLDPRQQHLLAGLGLFSGGATFAQLEAVLGPKLDGVPLLDVLQQLCERSWVRACAGQATRFGLLDSIHAFAGERLSLWPPAQVAELEGRLLAHWVGTTAALRHPLQAEAALRAHDWPAALPALVHALRRALRLRSAHVAALVLALDQVLTQRGAYAEVVALADEAVCLDAGDATVLAVRGRALLRLGENAAAQATLGAALGLALRTGDAGLQATVHFDLAWAQRLAGALAEAEASTRACLALEAHHAVPHGRAVAALGVIAKERGALADARRHYDEALRAHRKVKDAFGEARTLADSGALFQEVGDLREARECFDAALALHVHAERPWWQAAVRYDLGNLQLELGEPMGALDPYTRAQEALATSGDRRTHALVTALLGTTFSMLAEHPRARKEWQRAQVEAASLDDRIVDEVLRLARAHDGLPDSKEAVARAKAALTRARTEGDDGVVPSALSDDIRLAARVLERRLERVEGGALGLQLGPGGAWFRVGPGEPVSLGGRAKLRALLEALVAQRLDAPGVPMGLASLLAAGWPGERMSSESASNRVHVALASLRTLGLRAALVRDGGGYLLDPAMEVHRQRAPTAGSGERLVAAARRGETRPA